METKRAKVIMLPRTQKQNKSSIKLYQDKLFYDFRQFMSGTATHQHLYITTDDEIKEGDWILVGNEIIQAIQSYDIEGCDKIIATTNNNLFTEEDIIPYTSLPQPSKAFIEKYCKVGGIDEVMVEYTVKQKTQDELEWEGLSSDVSPYGLNLSKNILKINSHNEITIHPIKSNWTKEEIIQVYEEYHRAAIDLNITFTEFVNNL